ncbi:sperm acrosome-associated protein 9 isoform X2 [Desmodus rotundus]|uniref:sperm acrosome-associated protein 9 isoform X2 n=1 Tax=Desmodus rotundus TaxID=9430 RepID=UPI00238162BF|nr:sperm acrosome-associated protein 9 isoform X2 [Desmodus rotundus]
MNEAKGSLRSIEQKYKLFQQQQFTFITALEHCRENAHDKIRPISSIEQVQSYMEHHCSNATDRRVLHMFLDLCAELSRLCQRFESLHSGTPVTNSLLDKCKTLVSQSNDLSSLRANELVLREDQQPGGSPLAGRAGPDLCHSAEQSCACHVLLLTTKNIIHTWSRGRDLIKERGREKETSMQDRSIDWLPPRCTQARDQSRNLSVTAQLSNRDTPARANGTCL